MNKRQALIAAALATLCTAVAGTAAAARGEMEKCFGVAKAGQNDCAVANGAHSCAGEAKADLGPHDWKYVVKGSCEKAGGKLSAPAK